MKTTAKFGHVGRPGVAGRPSGEKREGREGASARLEHFPDGRFSNFDLAGVTAAR